MDNEILTSNDLIDTAASFRFLASEISTDLIPKLQADLKKLRDAGAPITSINDKVTEISDAGSKRNKCLTKATELDNKAILGILTSTDVTNAKAVLVCSTAKVRLAVSRLNEIRSVLKFVAAFIDLGAIIVSAGATGGIAFANIKNIIEKIDALSKVELSNGLSEAEKKILKACLPDGG